MNNTELMKRLHGALTIAQPHEDTSFVEGWNAAIDYALSLANQVDVEARKAEIAAAESTR